MLMEEEGEEESPHDMLLAPMLSSSWLPEGWVGRGGRQGTADPQGRAGQGGRGGEGRGGQGRRRVGGREGRGEGEAGQSVSSGPGSG